MNAPIEQFRAALRARNIIPPAYIVPGKMQRADVEGPHGKGDASFIYFDDGIPAGGFENHRDGLGWQKWRADVGRKLSPEEDAAHRARVEEIQRRRENEAAKRQARTSKRAQVIWDAAPPAPDDHPYLLAKGIEPHGARLYRGDLVLAGVSCDGALMLKMRDFDGNIQGIEFITPDGTKRFLGSWRGAFFGIPSTEKGGITSVVIVEGFATAASVAEATAKSVLITFTKDNLQAVACAVNRKQPDLPITIGADDDYNTPGNPGLSKAIAAARSVGGLVAVPDFGDDRPEGATDFNDLHRHRGTEAVRRAIETAREPAAVERQATN